MGYIFDPDRMQEIAVAGVGLPPEEMVRVVGEGLAEAYPEHIDTGQDWVYSLFCGSAAIMKIFHASLTEYVIIYGTPLGTNGFSGRYFLEIFDTVLCGEMGTYTEDNPLERVVYGPGERARLAPRKVKGFDVSPGGWMLEHGRGALPTALPVAVGDAIFSSMDPVTTGRTLWTYGKLALGQLLKGKL